MEFADTRVTKCTVCKQRCDMRSAAVEVVYINGQSMYHMLGGQYQSSHCYDCPFHDKHVTSYKCNLCKDTSKRTRVPDAL